MSGVSLTQATSAGQDHMETRKSGDEHALDYSNMLEAAS